MQVFLNTSTFLTPSGQLPNRKLDSGQYVPCLWMLGHPPFRGSSDSAITINILILNCMVSSLFDITIPTSTQLTSRIIQISQFDQLWSFVKSFPTPNFQNKIGIPHFEDHTLYVQMILILFTVESTVHPHLAPLLEPLLATFPAPLLDFSSHPSPSPTH